LEGGVVSLLACILLEGGDSESLLGRDLSGLADRSAPLGEDFASRGNVFVHNQIDVKLGASSLSHISICELVHELEQALIAWSLEALVGFFGGLRLLNLGLPVGAGKEHVTFFLLVRALKFIVRKAFVGNILNDGGHGGVLVVQTRKVVGRVVEHASVREVH